MTFPSNVAASLAAAAPTKPSEQPWTSHDTQVLIVAVLGIALVVLLIVWLKLHAFLALTIGALFVGIASSIPLEKVTASYEAGVGSVLGYVGVLIALGAMLGKLLADSGGADEVVQTLLRGRRATLPWKMALIAAIIGIPMFFEIGLVLLIPVVLLAVYRTKSPAMLLGIPALAGLSVLHGFVPPHPGPLAAIGILHANVGITLAFGLVVAVPAVIVAGPLFGRVAARLVPIGAACAGFAITGRSAGTDADTSSGATTAGTSLRTTPDGGSGRQRSSQALATQDPTPDGGSEHQRSAQGLATADPEATGRPSFTWTLITLLTPLVLMLIKAAADLLLPTGNPLRSFLDFVGDPVVALLIGVLLAMVTFGTKVGFSATVLSKKIGDSLLPIVGVVFIVGAGGGFKQALVDGGASTAIAKLATDVGLSALLLGWLVAVLIRLATGSATVATVTAGGIIAPLAAGLTQPSLALVVLAIGAGSLFFSHVNDAGFWLVKEYFGLSVGQTIKTWSVMETIISVIGLGMTALLSMFV